jgi:hypothetical protein
MLPVEHVFVKIQIECSTCIYLEIVNVLKDGRFINVTLSQFILSLSEFQIIEIFKYIKQHFSFKLL